MSENFKGTKDTKPNVLDVLDMDIKDFEKPLVENSMFKEYINKDILDMDIDVVNIEDIEYFLSIEKDEERLRELKSMLRNKSNLNTISEMIEYLEGVLKTPPEEFLKSGFTE